MYIPQNGGVNKFLGPATGKVTQMVTAGCWPAGGCGMAGSFQ
jgi:hypothetical protein